MHSKEILFIGHSLVEFFDWQNRFPGHKILNLGRAGETVEGLLSRIEGIIGEYPSADLIFIMTGLNNVAMEDFDFFGSYRKIIERLSSAYPGSGIFVHSLLPTLLDLIPDKSIQRVNHSLEKLSQETGAAFLDIYRLFVDEEGRAVQGYFLPDGVQLNDKGYAVWARALEGIVNR